MLKRFWASIREAMALDECRYVSEEYDDASDEFEDLVKSIGLPKRVGESDS